MSAAGVCSDSLNHPIQPNMLQRLGTNIVRVEVRAEQQFVDYTTDLDTAGIRLAYLIGPSSPTGPDLANTLDLCPTPYMTIIGNEPDIQGDSSWSMTPDEFAEFWNTTLQSVNTDSLLCGPGTYSPNFMQAAWDKLEIKPQLVNRHYPDTAEDIIAYTTAFAMPVVVGEMCYKTATPEQMHAYINMLQRHTKQYFWFVANEANHADMGLLSPNDYPTRAFYLYRSAIRSV